MRLESSSTTEGEIMNDKEVEWQVSFWCNIFALGFAIIGLIGYAGKAFALDGVVAADPCGANCVGTLYWHQSTSMGVEIVRHGDEASERIAGRIALVLAKEANTIRYMGSQEMFGKCFIFVPKKGSSQALFRVECGIFTTVPTTLNTSEEAEVVEFVRRYLEVIEGYFRGEHTPDIPSRPEDERSFPDCKEQFECLAA